MSGPGAEGVVQPGVQELLGAKPVLLTGGPPLRVVESGTLGLFRTELRDGQPHGPRQFVRRVGVGQPLLTAQTSQPDGMCLFVIPVRGAVLREVPLAPGWSDEGVRREELAPLFDQWVDLLTQMLSGLPESRLTVRLATSQRVELDEGQDLSAEHRRVIWVRLLEGSLDLLGDEERAIQVGDPPWPIAGGLFVRARSAATVEIFTTDDVERSEDLLSGLSVLENLALAHLRSADEKAEAKELARLGNRAKLQARRVRGAFSDLVSVLEPVEESDPGGPPLLVAARAVGRELGVEIKRPAKSEDLERTGDPLEAVCRASRLRMRYVRLSPAWWRKDCGPLLAWVRVDDKVRTVALLRRRGGYVAFDPSDGSRRRVSARFAQDFQPDAVVFHRPLPEGRLSLFDVVRFASRGRRGDLLLVLAVGVAATLLGMVVPMGTALLMDNAIPDANQRLLLEIGLGLGAAIFGQVIYRLSERIILLRVGIGAEAETQSALWDRLLRLRPSFFRRYSSGDLQSRVMAVSDVGQELTGNVITTLFSSLLALLNLGLLAFYSRTLSLLAVGIAAVVVVVTLSFGLSLRKVFRAVLDLDGRVFGLQIQLIQAVGKLRVAGAEVRAFTHWLKSYTEQLRLLSRALVLRDAASVFSMIVMPLSTVMLFVLAVDLLHSDPESGSTGGLSLGVFLAFNAAFGTFITGVSSLSSTVVGFFDTAAKAKRIEPILQELPEVDEHKADPGRLSGRLELTRVDFSYSAEGAKILDGVSLHAEPGEFIALVGPSGSGKSTVLRLLLGFEAAQSGTVSYDGQDLTTLDVLAVRRQLGVVLQNGRVNAGSIFDNISSGGILTLDAAWAAAEDAGFADDVRDMPMGMHTIVSEGGSNISGGQRQRLLIARAMATQPRLVYLDEATSALDNRTQAIVSESLERLSVTRVVVAHRLSTIRHADRIYVIEAGRVVESGSYEELMEAEGLFGRMMSRQLA